MSEFTDRTVVVTGAGSGIGWEMAQQFHERGALVFAADMTGAAPEGCTAVEVDVRDAASVEAMIARAVSATGRLDVLCNNAGIGSTKDPVSCSVEEWDAVFSVNVRGVFLGTKSALPHMLEQGSGAIVNTASVAGMVGLRDRAAYCASKGAVIAFTRAVAIQYAGTGIRCNAICPGTVDSPWVQRLLDDSEDPAQRRADLVARQPMGRLGQPAEIARAAVYLASDDAAFMTGSELVIDGGLTAG
jgi:NAD(P)-dependent dehydrogenase (short-subunit alcohol dehydrogenase family)